MSDNSYKNLNEANVRVEFLPEAPNLFYPNDIIEFDVRASQIDHFQKTNSISPFNLEGVSGFQNSATNEGVVPFSYLGLAKRRWHLNNFLHWTGDTERQRRNHRAFGLSRPEPSVEWTPIAIANFGDPSSSIFPSYIRSFRERGLSIIAVPPMPPDIIELFPRSYKGPKWNQEDLTYLPRPDDAATYEQLLDQLGYDGSTGGGVGVDDDGSDDTCPQPSSVWIHQTVAKSGLLWGIQSNDCIETKNLGFEILIDPDSPPSSEVNTFLIIKFSDYELLFQIGQKPILYDFKFSTPRVTMIPTKSDDQTIYNGEKLDVRFEIVAGRLSITINGHAFFYTRYNNFEEEEEVDGESQSIHEATIEEGSVTILGSNVSTRISLNLIDYPRLGGVGIRLPALSEINDGSYTGVTSRGEYRGSIFKIANQSMPNGYAYGIDAEIGVDDYSGEQVRPEGFGHNQKGVIIFRSTNSLRNIGFDPSGEDDWGLLILGSESIESENSSAFFSGMEVSNVFTPYFFRMKGGIPLLQDDERRSMVTPTSNVEVISASETFNAPDYFHVEKNASITLLDQGNFGQLQRGQSVVRLTWFWDDGEDDHDPEENAFIGIVMDVTYSQEAGKSVVILQCSDYSAALKTPIVNSPFYDGMIAYNAIENIAKRAGIITENVWPDEESYSLPSGYQFTEPAMRFESEEMLDGCILKIIQRYEGYYYFNSEGKMIVTRLPGGLFSENAGDQVEAEFFSRPSQTTSYDQVILNQLDIQYDFNSTVNNISIYSLDMETKDPIIAASTAPNGGALLYKKTFLYDQAALGGIHAVRSYLADLRARMFYPIMKVSIQVAGNYALRLKPLSFFTVDGYVFRAMSVKKSFDAEGNDLNISIDGEWLGGRQF